MKLAALSATQFVDYSGLQHLITRIAGLDLPAPRRLRQAEITLPRLNRSVKRAVLREPYGIFLRRRIGGLDIQKRISPFMKLAMSVGKREGTGIAMIDGRTIVNPTPGCDKFKIAVIY
jgi:hypothetical protein